MQAPICRVLAIVFALLIALGAGAMAAQTPNLSIIAAPVSEPPVLDGVLDDPAWLTASLYGAKAVVDTGNTGVAITNFPRVAYVAYDANAIYVAFVNYSPNPANLGTSEEVNIHNNDEVEVFIQPEEGGDYKQIIVDAANRMREREPATGAQAVVAKSEIQWIVEIAIPLEGLGVTPKAGDVWKINLNGHQVADGNIWVSWNPTYGGFHNPNRFGTLTFAAPVE